MNEPAVPSQPILLRLTSWLMIASATVFGPICWQAAVSHSSDRYPGLLGVYLLMAAFVFGVGLKKQFFWAWEGTAYLTVFVAEIAVPVAFLAFESNPTASRVVSFLVLAICLAVPSLLFLRILLSPAVKTAFEMSASDSSPHPNYWIRLIAMSNLIGFGLTLLNLFGMHAKPLFGLFKNPAARDIYSVLVACLVLYIGRGLYRLDESARQLAIWSTVALEIELATSALVAPFAKLTVLVALVLPMILSVVQIWYLHYCRDLFRANSETASRKDAENQGLFP